MILLSQAPFDHSLVLKKIKDPDLEALLSRLGLFRGDTFVRENEEILLAVEEVGRMLTGLVRSTKNK